MYLSGSLFFCLDPGGDRDTVRESKQRHQNGSERARPVHAHRHYNWKCNQRRFDRIPVHNKCKCFLLLEILFE
jgi:hypothetical protein